MGETSGRGDRAETVDAAERGEIGGGGGNNEAGIAPFGPPAGADAPNPEEAADIGRELAGGRTAGDLTGRSIVGGATG